MRCCECYLNYTFEKVKTQRAEFGLAAENSYLWEKIIVCNTNLSIPELDTVYLHQKLDIYNRIPNLVNAQRRIGIDKKQKLGRRGRWFGGESGCRDNLEWLLKIFRYGKIKY